MILHNSAEDLDDVIEVRILNDYGEDVMWKALRCHSFHVDDRIRCAPSCKAKTSRSLTYRLNSVPPVGGRMNG